MRLNNKIIIILIIIVATILRFINYCEIPFTHDEFSALFRLDFSSFSELIEKGVKIDGHPAGIQVFLYYWTNLFGMSEWIVKLPFTVMGILSVFLIYLIGKKWYNETVGLISATFLASIQYTVIHSQIARPYISGLFFSLLMVHFWTEIMLSPYKNFYKNSLFFILTATLCAYNHHFSLLFAIIAGISGLFFIKKPYLKKYILCGVIIFLLYIPHLNIFFYQLNIGGVEGWLAKPDNTFIIKFLFYIFNFSFLSVLTAIALIILGIFHTAQKKFSPKKLILFAGWFLVPFLTGFFYSKYLHAVLQFSVLIFTAPFLFFILFGHIKSFSPRTNLIIVIVILTVNIFSLTTERKHYKLLYESPYEQILKDHLEAHNENDSITSIIDSHKKITNYYLEKQSCNPDFVWYDSFEGIEDFIIFLKTQSKIKNKLYLGCLSSNNPLTVPVIQDYFPAKISQKNYVGGTTYLFSGNNHKKTTIIELQGFESNSNDNWTSIKETNLTGTESFEGTYSYLIDSLTEWSPTCSVLLDKIINNQNNFIDISVKVKYRNNNFDALLVATLETPEKEIHWDGTPLEIFTVSKNSEENWFTAHHSIKLSDIPLNHNNIKLKTYIWNKGRESFLIDNFKIELRNGNPVIYGLTEKI